MKGTFWRFKKYFKMSVKLLKMNVKNKILFLPKDTFHILHNTYYHFTIFIKFSKYINFY